MKELSTDLYIETANYIRPLFSRARDTFGSVPDNQTWIFEGSPDSTGFVVGGEAQNSNLPRIPFLYPIPLHKFWKWVEVPCEVCLFEEVGLSIKIHLLVLVVLSQPLKYLEAIRKQNIICQETPDLLKIPLTKALRNMLSWTVQRPGKLISPLASQDLKPGNLTKLLSDTEITSYVASQPDFAACGVEVRVRVEDLSTSPEYKMALNRATKALSGTLQTSTIEYLMGVVSMPEDGGELSFREECYNALAPSLEEEIFDPISNVLEEVIYQTISGNINRPPKLKFLMQALFKDVLRDQLILYLRTRLAPTMPKNVPAQPQQTSLVASYTHLNSPNEWVQPPTALPTVYQMPPADPVQQVSKTIQPSVAQDTPDDRAVPTVSQKQPKPVTMSSPVQASSGIQMLPDREALKNKSQQRAMILARRRRHRRSVPAKLKNKPQEAQGLQAPQASQKAQDLLPVPRDLPAQPAEQSSVIPPLDNITSSPSEGTVLVSPSGSPLVQPKKDLTPNALPLSESSESEDAIVTSNQPGEKVSPSMPSLGPTGETAVLGTQLAPASQQESVSQPTLPILPSAADSMQDPEPAHQSPFKAEASYAHTVTNTPMDKAQVMQENADKGMATQPQIQQHKLVPTTSSPAQNLLQPAQASKTPPVLPQQINEAIASPQLSQVQPPPQLGQVQPPPIDHLETQPFVSPASPPPKLTRGQLKLARYPTQKLLPLQGLNGLPLDKLAGQSPMASNTLPPRSASPRSASSQVAIDEKKYRAAIKMSREEQINYLYAACEQAEKWIIRPEKDDISEDLYVDIGKNYKVWIRGISDVYPEVPPVVQVVRRIEKLPQSAVNEIVVPLLNSGSNLYQLVKAIADALPDLERLLKNNNNIIV